MQSCWVDHSWSCVSSEHVLLCVPSGFWASHTRAGMYAVPGQHLQRGRGRLCVMPDRLCNQWPGGHFMPRYAGGCNVTASCIAAFAS